MKPFDETRFDDAFRSKLGDYSETPPAEVFSRLQQSFPKGGSANPPWFARYWMFVAIPGIAGLIALSLSLTSADESVSIRQNQSQNPWIAENNGVDNSTATQPAAEVKTTEAKEYHAAEATTNTSEIMQKATSVTSEVSSENSSEVKESINSVVTAAKKEEVSVTISKTASTCRQPNGSIELSSANGLRYQYFWQDLGGSQSVAKRTNLAANTYSVRVVSEGGTEKTYEIVLPDTGSVKALFSHQEVSSTAGMPIYFQNKSRYGTSSWTTTSAVSFRWYFGDGSSSQLAEPEHIYQKEGNYTISLVAVSFLGCRDSAALPGFVISGSDVEMPNMFSPNNDGISDQFRPDITGIVNVKCIIFNRLGEIVYEWEGMDGYWDGKIQKTNNDAAPGVYYYVLTGTGTDGKQFTRKSFVQLFR